MSPIKVGIVGCGNISDAYLRGGKGSNIVDVTSVADRSHELAEAKAEDYDVSAVSVEELLRNPDISIVINLTNPAAHFDVSSMIIAAGKHVYSEKPIAATFAEGTALMDLAREHGVRIGCAPDTFLGAGHQRVRRLIDEGAIGTITGGAAVFATPGMEMWHPNPFFFFKKGGGPVLDIGCYPITQLVNCLGPVAAVVAHASKGQQTRTVTNGPHDGREFKVEVPTTVNGILDFADGANVAFTASWDVWKHDRAPIEIYGTEGSISNPDPNFFGGPVKRSDRNGAWLDVPIDGLPFGAPNQESSGNRMVANYRMAGVFDMAAAIVTDRPHRANGELALHVLEVMEGLEIAAKEGRRITMTRRCERPDTVPAGSGEEVFLA